MSLTSRLKNDHELSLQLSRLVLETTSIKLDMVAPPHTSNYALVGTAFDYLMRMELAHRVPSARTEKWVAEVAADVISTDDELFGHIWRDTIIQGFRDALRVAKDRMVTYQKNPTVQHRRELAISALSLAKMEGGAKAMYPLDFFSAMVRAMPSEGDANIGFGNAYPMKVEFSFADGNGSASFLLAPRVEED